MQHSVITASDGCSSEMVHLLNSYHMFGPGEMSIYNRNKDVTSHELRQNSLFHNFLSEPVCI